MATNPVIKMKRGTYENLPTTSIDGQIYFASNGESALESRYNGAGAGKDTSFNTLSFDVQEGNSVIRRDLDAYRAIHALSAGTAETAGRAFALGQEGQGAGNTSTPIYLDNNGTPQVVTSIPASMLSGTIDLARIPHSAQERVLVLNDPTGDTIRALSSSEVQLGDVIRNTADDLMYYVVPSADAEHTPAGDIRGTNFNFARFSAGAAANADYATEAGSIKNGSISLTRGATGSGSYSSGSSSVSINVTALRLSKVNSSDSAVTITGKLPVANGGTNLASYTKGDLIYASAGTTLAKLAIGSSTQVLGVSSGVPAWINIGDLSVASAGTLTSAMSINGTSFNAGSSSDTARWGDPRNVYIRDKDGSNTGAATEMGGNSGGASGLGHPDTNPYYLYLPQNIKATLKGNADSATVANTLKKQLTITIKNLDGTDTDQVFTYGKDATNDTSASINPNYMFPVATLTYANAITAGTWATVSIPSGTTLTSGTYLVQIYCNESHFSGEYFSGVMSYANVDGGTGQSDSDEVLLHCSGPGISGHHIYLRTRRSANAKPIIEITSDVTTSAVSNAFQIKLRRMI